jgi:predicted ATP-grasp superfamily ATP-dependent carboligase
MKVFITDGNLRSTLAAVRSLGRAGVVVGTGNDTSEMIAGASKYCREKLIYPSPVLEPDGFQSFLCEQLAARGYTHLLAMSDVTVQLVAPLKSRLAPAITAMVEDAETLLLVQDKAAMLGLAREVNVGTPRYITRGVTCDTGGCDRESLLRFADSVGYPVVIKPRRSRQYLQGKWSEGSVTYAHTPEELIAKYEAAHRSIPDPLVQEKLAGEGRGVFLLMWKGEVKAAFCHRRLREKPPWGGVSVLGESLPIDRALVERSAALLRAVPWNGPAMVEYKTDARDGEAKLMEVNGRFWGSLQLAIDAGIDFPTIYYRLICGEDVAAQLEYRAGVKSRWLLGDLDSLITRLRCSAEQKHLYRSSVSRLRVCADFCHFFGRELHYDVLSASDPKPGWEELKQYIPLNLRLLLSRQTPVHAGGTHS